MPFCPIVLGWLLTVIVGIPLATGNSRDQEVELPSPGCFSWTSWVLITPLSIIRLRYKSPEFSTESVLGLASSVKRMSFDVSIQGAGCATRAPKSAFLFGSICQ